MLAITALGIVPAQAKNVPPGINCSAIPGITDYLQGHRIVMFGENHGTNEMPASFLRVVCIALQQGAEVSVGLEQPMDQAQPLAAYLSSNGDLAARDALLQTNFWNKGKDGRTSVAMLEMIDGLRRLRQAGYPLTVFPMQGRSADWHLRNDEKMAESVRTEFSARPTSLILTLSGNVHNMKTKPSWLPVEVPAPIPTYLKDLKADTFDLTSTGGSAWNCQKECGVHSYFAHAGPEEFVVIVSDQKDAYSGAINVGVTTASPPAAAAAKPIVRECPLPPGSCA
jgi:hypothetical protein